MENLTITERPPIVIDGCFVPFEIYDRVKSCAQSTRKTQFIGVVYEQPEELRKTAQGESWDWGTIMKRNAVRRVHMAAGEHLVYVLDQTRDQLLLRGDLAMILWITPFD